MTANQHSEGTDLEAPESIDWQAIAEEFAWIHLTNVADDLHADFWRLAETFGTDGDHPTPGEIGRMYDQLQLASRYLDVLATAYGYKVEDLELGEMDRQAGIQPAEF